MYLRPSVIIFTFRQFLYELYYIVSLRNILTVKGKLQNIEVIFHSKNEKIKLSNINWILNVLRGNLITKLKFPVKDNDIDRMSIKWV